MRTSKLVAMLMVAVLIVSAAMAEEAIELKTSKEIKSSIFGTQTKCGEGANYKEVMPLVEKTGLKWIREISYWGAAEQEKGNGES